MLSAVSDEPSTARPRSGRSRARSTGSWFTLGVGVAICGVLLYSLVTLMAILIGGRDSRIAPIAKIQAREAQELATSFRYVLTPPLDTAAEDARASASALRAALTDAELLAYERTGAPDLDGALASVVEFLSALSTGDPSRYAAWRESQGFRIVDAFPGAPEFDRAWHDGPYRTLVGEDPPANISPRAYFNAMFEAFFGQSGGALRPVSHATSPRSVEILAGRATHPRDHLGHLPPPEGSLGPEFWLGGIGAGATPFWVYERTTEEMIERDGGCWRALVRCVARGGPETPGAPGAAIPMAFSLRYDPRPDRGWRVVGWSVNNVGKDVWVTKATFVAPVF